MSPSAKDLGAFTRISIHVTDSPRVQKRRGMPTTFPKTHKSLSPHKLQQPSIMLINTRSAMKLAVPLWSLVASVSGNLEGQAPNNTTLSIHEDAVSILRGCDQGCYPDFDQGFDLLREGSSSGNRRWLRIRHCDKCFKKEIFGENYECGRSQMCNDDVYVCIDRKKKRAHRIINNGAKVCFYLEERTVCPKTGNRKSDLKVWKISEKLDRCPW
jgi:hypothetical protein